MMIGLVALNSEGLGAMMYYVIVYGFMNLGAFAGAILFANETGSDKIDDYAGLIRKRPLLALGMSVCLLNLAGLPIPPAGFFAKIFIFWAGSSVQTPIGGIPLGALLVAIGLATSVPALYYYSQVVIKMIVDKPSAKVEALPKEKAYIDSPQEAPALALAMCLIVIVATGTTAVDPVMRFSKEAVRPLLAHPSSGQTPVSMIEEWSPFRRGMDIAGTGITH